MVQLRQSPSLDEAKKKYDQLWEQLLDYEEKEARELIDAFAQQANLQDFKKREAKEFKDYLRTPYPYIAILAGIALPVSAFLLIMLLP
ncbi:MAG: hypothetical protein E6Y08_18120 [Paenibacillus sp.]|uniref:hypothetical protein n=1 Tax=Paenibacillus sp. TaxID=58172 RepID=UPI002905FBC5|nr:hypothetical protein [Paenibacillus sp.]MDU4697725.1 hypothetical protein [Paenibacillus sp.]